MLCRTWALLKKRAPPMGYSQRMLRRKLNSPRASKPWRNRDALKSGTLDLTPQSEAQPAAGHALPTMESPLGLRSPHHQQQLLVGGRDGVMALPPGSSGALAEGNGSGSRALAEAGGALDGSAPPLATIPMGKALQLDVNEVDTYGSGNSSSSSSGSGDGAVPVSLQHLKRRSRREAADGIALPKHLNQLFHKIMGWSEDLVELEAAPAPAGEAGEPSAQQARRQMANLTEKMKYGVLLEDYEKDKFALEQKLEVAGTKLERKFLEWEGAHVLDQDASAEMEKALESKAAIVIDTPLARDSIPVVNRTCCPGCGALLQDTSESEFGYVKKGEIERFLTERARVAQVKAEYAARMAELQAHWERHGRQVGEEWLDFMTQEEFDAFYRHVPRPFTCHRCHALEHLGVTGRRKIMAAPDFTEQLRALKEKRCVIVLVVDLTDFPGSMVRDLPGLISMNNDVIIVANKADCIRRRSFRYRGTNRAVAATLTSQSYLRRWVTDIAVQFGLPRHRIRRVIPVSARRGWNIDELIAAIEDLANLNLRRPHRPLPTYVVGVANVGKSSVINAIAHHLYVPQPPHPASTKVYYTRTDAATGEDSVHWRWYTPPNVNRAEMTDIPARHDKRASKLLTVSTLPGTTVAVNGVRVALGGARGGRGAANPRATSEGNSADQEMHDTHTYLYDTPGLLPHWHARSPLTLLQMRRTLIRYYRNPQCFILCPGHTLHLGGLAAIDVVKGPATGILFMCYTAAKTRNGIVRTELSDRFWAEQLGRALDPPGSLEQLTSSSGGGGGGGASLSLRRHYLFECYAQHRRRPKADVYVCGLGWASFCVSCPSDVVLAVRTLPGVVHGVRQPLRYNDLRAFRFWPKLQRGSTPKGLADRERAAGDDDSEDSIQTVVRLTAQPVTDSDAGTRVVARAEHPHHRAAAAEPLDRLLEEMAGRE